MNVLLTGGAGYIGSHVVRVLASAGHHCVAYDNLSAGHPPAVGQAPLVVGDIIDAEAATTWHTNRGGHVTVVEGTGPSWDDIEHFLHVNLSRARGNGR